MAIIPAELQRHQRRDKRLLTVEDGGRTHAHFRGIGSQRRYEGAAVREVICLGIHTAVNVLRTAAAAVYQVNHSTALRVLVVPGQPEQSLFLTPHIKNGQNGTHTGACGTSGGGSLKPKTIF